MTAALGPINFSRQRHGAVVIPAGMQFISPNCRYETCRKVVLPRMSWAARTFRWWPWGRRVAVDVAEVSYARS